MQHAIQHMNHFGRCHCGHITHSLTHTGSLQFRQSLSHCPAARQAAHSSCLYHSGIAPGSVYNLALRAAQTATSTAAACYWAPWAGSRAQQWRTQTSAASRDDLLKGCPPDYREEVARAVELAMRAGNQWSMLFTDFLTPPVAAHALAAVGQLAGVSALAFGGYVQAERCRLILGQEDLVEGLRADPEQAEAVAALHVRGNFMFDPATHRDFLGSILGTGVERAKVGDILLTGETGAQILVAADLVPHFEHSLTQVRRVPVQTQRMPLAGLSVRPAKTEQLRSVEASLRLDAVASAGFRVSRAKAADLVKSGDIRLNWTSAKVSAEVKQGDVLSCAGKGRVEIVSANLTKKGRYAVEMMRYV